LLKRLLKNLRWSVLPVPTRVLAVIFLVFLFFIPLINATNYIMLIFTFANIFVIFTVSWDLLSGYTGLVNFGHALFFGVGAYGSALLYKHLGWQPWATIPLGALAATAIGVITCFPALKLRGPYLSLLTLAFPLMLYGIVVAIPMRIAGGSYGIYPIPALASSPVSGYYLVLIVMIVSVLIMWKLTDAGSKYIRTGLIFHAIREDEIAARAVGIDTIRYKMLAFAIGGLFAGIAGGLYAHTQMVCAPGTLDMTMSFQVIIWAIFGGIVSIYGSVVGVYTLYPLTELLRKFSEYRTLILVIIVILVLLFMPQGIAVWIRDKIERECPRCKLRNAAWRRECRACSAALH